MRKAQMVGLYIPFHTRLVALDEGFGNLAGFMNVRRAGIQTDGTECVAKELDTRGRFLRPVMQQGFCLSFISWSPGSPMRSSALVTEDTGETRSWQIRDATYAERRAGSIDDIVSPVGNSVAMAAGLGAPPSLSIKAA
jgi:hypothetical protein